VSVSRLKHIPGFNIDRVAAAAGDNPNVLRLENLDIDTWHERRLVEDRMETFAEGLATRTAFELPQRILWRFLDDFVLVSDDEIRAAQALMIETTRKPRRGGRRSAIGGRSQAARAADRQAGRVDSERRQRKPGTTPRRADAKPRDPDRSASRDAHGDLVDGRTKPRPWRRRARFRPLWYVGVR
jgi:hypothetical protein